MSIAASSFATHACPPRSTSLRSTSLQERDDSWRVLSEAFTRVEQQRRSELFLIRGEAGVGRSRLLEDTIAWTSARGATVLHARLALSNMALSYATLGALLRSGIDAPGLGGIDGVYLRELMTLVPELSSRFRGIERSPSTSGVPGWSLLDAVSQALRAMGEDAPVVIAIDDATWCDRESGGMLQSLIEQLSQEPILWLATMSDDDASTASTLPAFLSTHATQLTLESLTALSIAAMVRESSELDAEWSAFADSVHAVTHGVPALVHAVLAQMLAEYGGDWQSVRLATATVPVPEPANAMVRRIDSLSDMEREVLIALALLVEGLQLTPEEWKETPSLTPHLLSHVHGISRLRAARIGESLVELRLARVSNSGLQCISPVIAKFMVTNGSSIMRDELRRRLRHVRR